MPMSGVQKYEISVVEKKEESSGTRKSDGSNWLFMIVALTFLLFIILVIRAILLYYNKSFHPLSIVVEYGRRSFNFCRDLLRKRCKRECNGIDLDVYKETEYLLQENTTNTSNSHVVDDPIRPSPCGVTSSSSSTTLFGSDSEMPEAATEAVMELLLAKIVYRTFTTAKGGVIIQPGVSYSIRGYFLPKTPMSGFQFVTISPLQQHWHINFEDNLTVMELIEPIALDPVPFTRFYRDSRDVAEAADLSTTPQHPCLNSLQ